MKAFLIAYITVKDSEKMNAYAKAAGESMQAYGGKVLTKGIAQQQLAGEHEPQNVAVICFPDIESLESWYNSEGYQKIIPLRKEAADIIITSYVTPD